MTTGNAIELNVESRGIGKHASRTLRTEKFVPGVLYGSKVENTPLKVEEKMVVKYSSRKYENALFKLKSEDNKLNGVQVLMKDLTIHPVSRRPVHFDFYAVDLTQTVVVSVKLEFTGKAAGLQEGGLLQVIRHELEVECLPTNIPEKIEVDVSDLGVHDSLHVSDVNLPQDVKPATDDKLTIVTVTVVKEEEEAPVAAEAAAEGAAEPEIVGAKGKQEEAPPAGDGGGEDKKDS